MNDELGDTPEPTVEEPERFPGGVDAIDDEEKYGDVPDVPIARDLKVPDPQVPDPDGD